MGKILLVILECNRPIYQDKLLELIRIFINNNLNFEVYVNHDNEEKKLINHIENNKYENIVIIDGDYSSLVTEIINKKNICCFVPYSSPVKIDNVDNLFTVDDNNHLEFLKHLKNVNKKIKKNKYKKSNDNNIFVLVDNFLTKIQVKKELKKLKLKAKNNKILLINKYLLFKKQSKKTILIHNDYYDKIKNLINSIYIFELMESNSILIYLTKNYNDSSPYHHLYYFLKERNKNVSLREIDKLDDLNLSLNLDKMKLDNNLKKLIKCYSEKKLVKNKIIFTSYENNQYSCNPKYLTEYILQNNLKYKIVWIFNNLNHEYVDYLISRGVKCVEYKSIEYFQEILTAKFIVSNQRMDFLVNKRKNQIYFQAWHASLDFKEIEKQSRTFLTPEWLKTAIKDCYNTDFMIGGCQKQKKSFEKSMWYNHEILEVGTPRNDIFFNPDYQKINDLKEKYNIGKEKKIVLYAPTFRNKYEFDYNIDYKKIIKLMKKKYKGDWIFAIKLHPNINDKNYFSKEIINFSSEDTQEILLISDIVISDYSSLIIDYFSRKKPIFLYTPDYDKYINEERKLNKNYFEIPFSLAMNIEELETNILNFEYEKYLNSLEKYLKEIGSYENGDASQMIMEYMKEIAKKN